MNWPRELSKERTERVVVIMSDIEMGAGGALDDFPHSDWLGELILSYNEGEFADRPLDLVFNGDTFDFLKVSFRGGYPRHISGEVARGKTVRVAAAHPGFFDALRRFLNHEGAERNVHFIIGNHDPEIVFPDVQDLIRTMAGGSDRIHFPGFALDIGSLHVEHGNQLDPLFAFDPDELYVTAETGEDLLNLPWASVALLDVAIPMHGDLHFHDRCVPKDEVLALLPEIKELLLERYWSYWTRDYWKGSRSDPLKKVTWTMLKEIFGRYFFSHDPEVSPIGEVFIQKVREDKSIDLCVIGHVHSPALWCYGRQRMIQAGCLRDEYVLDDEEGNYTPLPKSYVEVYMAEGRPIRSHLVEVDGPEVDPDWRPETLLDARERIRGLLAPAAVREKGLAEQAAQLEKEAVEEGSREGDALLEATDSEDAQD
jgi:UDP-2,3-diacylglucosamine pyrophosphatase LpxH